MPVLTEDLKKKIKDELLGEETLFELDEEGFLDKLIGLYEEAVTDATETLEKKVRELDFKFHFHSMTHGLTDEQRQRLWKLCDEMPMEMAANYDFLATMRDTIAGKGGYRLRGKQDFWGDHEAGRPPQSSASPDKTFHREGTDPMVAAAVAITEAGRMPSDPYADAAEPERRPPGLPMRRDLR